MRTLIILCAALCLTSCGVIYHSPSIKAGGVGDDRVHVVAITGESLLVANQSAYKPRALPLAFSQSAGAGAGLQPAQNLPQGVLSQPTRPVQVEMRLPPPVTPGPYRLGVGDVVLLATPNAGTAVAELTGLLAAQNSRQGYMVQDDGAVAIPNVGRVKVANMTVDEAEVALFQVLIQNQMDTGFSLEIAEFNAHRVAVGGAVVHPMLAPVTLTPLYLDEVIAAAGGITAPDQGFASVRIYRAGSLYQIPLSALYSNPDLMRTRLIAGDSVFVDTQYDLVQAQIFFEQQIMLDRAQRQTREDALDTLFTEVSLRRAALEEARSNYVARTEFGAEPRDYVYLTGEVETQMRFALPYEQQATLADALYDKAQGIPVRTGDISQIYVLRASTNPGDLGAVTAWRLDLQNAINLTLAARFELRPNDVVFVAEQPVTRWGRVIDQITPSLITTPMTEAKSY